jgi:hypothetical protein
MIMKTKTLLLYSICLVSICIGALTANAFTTVAINSEVDADFGEIDYNSTSTGNIDMGSNGVISYPAGFAGTGLGVSGQFRIVVSGTNTGASYTITCSDTGTQLSDANAHFIGVDADFAISAASRTNYGSGIDCNNATNGPYSGTPRNVYLGMRLRINSPLAAPGIYSTTNMGGIPLTIIVVLM